MEKKEAILGLVGLDFDAWKNQDIIGYFNKKLKDRNIKGSVTSVRYRVDPSLLQTLGISDTRIDEAIILVYFDLIEAASAFFYGYTGKYDMFYCGKESTAISDNLTRSSCSQDAIVDFATPRHQTAHPEDHFKLVPRTRKVELEVPGFKGNAEKQKRRPRQRVLDESVEDPNYENVPNDRKQPDSDSAHEIPCLPPKTQAYSGRKYSLDDPRVTSTSKKDLPSKTRCDQHCKYPYDDARSVPTDKEPHELPTKAGDYHDRKYHLRDVQQENLFDSASESPDRNAQHLTLVVFMNSSASEVQAQMERLMVKNKVAGSVSGVLSQLTTADIGMYEKSGTCAVITFSDETCGNRVKTILEGSGHIVASLPEQLFCPTTVQFNPELFDQVSKWMDLKKLAKQYSITLTSGVQSMHCKGDWLNLRLFESKVKEMIAHKRMGEEKQREQPSGETLLRLDSKVNTFKPKPECGAERTRDMSEGKGNNTEKDPRGYVEMPDKFKPLTSPRSSTVCYPLVQNSNPQKQSLISVRLRSGSQGHGNGGGSETQSPELSDQVQRKLTGVDGSTSWSTRDQRRKRYVHMPPPGEGPQSPEVTDDTEMFHDAVEDESELMILRGSGSDIRDPGRRDEYDISRPSPRGAMGDEFDDWAQRTGVQNWNSDHYANIQMEPGRAVPRRKERINKRVDVVGSSISSDKGLDAQKTHSSSDVPSMPPRRKKPVLTDPPSKEPEEASCKQTVKVTPILFAYMTKQSDVKSIESKYNVRIQSSEDSITVFGDDHNDVSKAVQRINEAKTAILEEVEIEGSSQVPSHLVGAVEKMVQSAADTVTCVFDRDSQRVFCMGDGAQNLIREVDLMIDSKRKLKQPRGTEREYDELVDSERDKEEVYGRALEKEQEYEETIHIDSAVAKYLSIPDKMPQIDDKVSLNIQISEDEEIGIITIKANDEAKLKRVVDAFREQTERLSNIIVKEHVRLESIGAVEEKLRRFRNILAQLHKDFMMVDLIGPEKAVKEARIEILKMSKETVRPKDAFKGVHRLSQSVGATGFTELMSFWTTVSSGRKVHVHALVHDITRMQVDVIVNAANERLQHGGGVARAIADAAGRELEEDCKEYIKKNGKINVTNHYISKSGHLPCKHVMHAVGPVWDRRGDMEKQERLASQLQETFRKCLEEASERKYSSIAIPPVSAGIFGFPPYTVAEILAKCVADFARTQKHNLTDIYLVDLSPETVKMIQKQLQQHDILRKEESFTGGDAVLGLTHQSGGRRKRVLYEHADHATSGKAERGPGSALRISTDPEQSTQAAMADVRRQDPMFAGGPSIPTSPSSPSSHMPLSRSKSVSTPSFSPSSANSPVPASLGPLSPTSEFTSYLPESPWSQNSSAKGPAAKSAFKPDPDAAPDKEDCPICLDPIEDLKCLDKCGHKFCNGCIQESFQHKPVCPICGVLYGKITGNQPTNGTMNHYVRKHDSLPGYRGCGTIVIDYAFPSGRQGPEHPNPGEYYSGTAKRAYFPDNHEGRKVLGLLKQAFKARLIFTIGRCVTSGQENTVTWNDIHHKTNTHGGPERYGYPDPTYLSRVTQELAAKGITF